MTDSLKDRLLFMTGLILAGEAVFALPFHIARFFRPTVLEVFDISATELGIAQGVYGLVAMLAYFAGGPLADRFSERKLLAWSLWSTAAGGIYMATFPGATGAGWMWGFFGVTTILLFWAALIKATRVWGGEDSQGRAYGLLEGGRGLLAAALASIAVLAFALAFPDGYEAATLEEKQVALRIVIYGYTLVTALTGVLIWFAIPEAIDQETINQETINQETINQETIDRETSGPESATASTTSSTALSTAFLAAPRNVLATALATVGRLTATVVRLPAIWLQALIVLCAYVAYKGYDNYSLFAVQAWGLDEVDAAFIVALGSWLRPVAALAAGLIADRVSGARTLLACFAILLASDLFFATVVPLPSAIWILFGNMVIGMTAFFAMRGVYFALLQETKVPLAMTGTAIGIVSVIGFTPDIFVAYVAGLMIDRSPGATGHQHFFMFLSAFAALGVAASYLLARRVSKA